MHAFLANEKPDYLFIAAAKVGGIQANNQYRADFLYQNQLIEANVMYGARQAGVQRLMLLRSSCSYPRACAQPIKESHLLTGSPEPTNESYGIAKMAGTKLDGTPQKLLDVSRLAGLGWRYGTTLQDGIRKSNADYLASR